MNRSPDLAVVNPALWRGAHIKAHSTLAGSPYFVAEDFLPPDELDHVLSFAFGRKDAFSASSVSNAAHDYRRSHVLYDVNAVRTFFMPRLQALRPSVWPLLKMAPMLVTNIECQMTAHGAGDYFKLHNDNGSPESAARTVTYVFYFNRFPKAFSGGELRLYETEVRDGFYACGTQFENVEPRHNSLVMFPSHCHHEVLPIASDSDAFEDRRFTINGWFVRGV